MSANKTSVHSCLLSDKHRGGGAREAQPKIVRHHRSQDIRPLLSMIATYMAATLSVGTATDLKAETASLPPVSSLSWQYDWLQRAARGIGVVRTPSDDNFEICPAAIISNDYILQPDCEDAPRGSKKKFYMQGKWEEHAYDLEDEPAEQGDGWRIYKVNGRPSQHFGVVRTYAEAWRRLQPETPRRIHPDQLKTPLHVIRVLPDQREPAGFIKVYCNVEVRLEPPYLAYGPPSPEWYGPRDFGPPREIGPACERETATPSSPVDFIFLVGELIAIQYKPRSTSGTSSLAVPIPEIVADGRLLRQVTDYSEGYDINLTCETAASYSTEQDKLLMLDPHVFNQFPVYLRACAEQIAINKDRAPEERALVLIRTLSFGTEFKFEYLTRNDDAKILFACIADTQGLAPPPELYRVWEARANKSDGRLDWDELKIGCPAVTGRFLGNDPFLISKTVSESDLQIMRKHLEEAGANMYASEIENLWRAPSTAASASPNRPSEQTGHGTGISPSAAPGEDVKVGKLDERCLYSWHDSHQPHSTRFVVRWNYQAGKTTMKALRHCIKLTTVGPVEVGDIAKDLVSDCVDYALNHDRTQHFVKVLIGIAIDVSSKGSTGGKATAAALADYVIAVKERAISCLTDAKQVEARLTKKLRSKFDGTVEKESHWEYWEL